MTLQKAYEICIEKFKQHEKKYNIGSYDSVFLHNGDYYEVCQCADFYDYDQWLASFFTGLAPLYFRTEKDEKYLAWANRFRTDYCKKVNDYSMETMHDLGFLYQPYSVAMYQLTGDENHKNDALQAADVLLKRFCIYGRYIDAWNRMDEENIEGRAIADTMMNIQLLLWAWKETKHRIYRDVAVAHSETVAKYFIREDFSVAHSFVFDRRTGKMLKESNTCGYGNGSQWARGTAWVMFGFATLALYLEEKKYFEIAKNIAEKYIQETGQDVLIPLWDFRLPEDKPACKYYNCKADWDETDPRNKEFAVDTSAAAVAACAMLYIDQFLPCPEIKEFAEKSIKALCDEKYFHINPKNPGILKRQNGRMCTCCFGDYYFVEALQRILYPGIQTCWF